MSKIETATVAACTGVIGQALVHSLVASGVRVVGICREGSRNKGEDIEAKYEGSYQVLTGDMSDPKQCEQIANQAFDMCGGSLSAHFHAVGYYLWSTWDKVEPAEVDRLWRANFSTAWSLGTALYKKMCAQRFGHLVFVSARDTQTMAPVGHGPYMASKAALNMLVQSLAAESRAHGIKVNAVLPTIIDTDVNRQAMPDADSNDWVSPERLAKVMIQICQPEWKDISGALIPVNSGVF